MGELVGFDSIKPVCTVDLFNKVCFHDGKSILVRIQDGTNFRGVDWLKRTLVQAEMTCRNADPQMLDEEKLEDKCDRYNHGKFEDHGAKCLLDSTSSG